MNKIKWKQDRLLESGVEPCRGYLVKIVICQKVSLPSTFF